MENELYHHGIKGQKWGVRRYQNKDGSLTLAGKKRALKMQDQYTKLSNNKKYRDKDGNLTYAGRKKALNMKEKYSDLTGKQLKKYPSDKSDSKPKTKSISDMSNEEIQSKIDRIRLENTLKSLTPNQTTKGERFVNGLKNAAVSIAKDKGTKIVGDYIDKQLRDKLGIKDEKSASKILQEKAQDYENRQKIDKGQKYFKEGKYAEQKTDSSSNNKNNDSDKTETWSGTVEGFGTSKAKTEGQKWTSNNKSKSDPIDVEWSEVNDDNISAGRSYTSQFLLEDKKRK